MSAPARAPKRSSWATIKITAAARKTVDRLVGLAAEEGWQKFGVQRSDKPTIGALVEEGLRALEARAR